MCALQFKNNNCDAPIPAMIQQCGNWETCMNRDPTIVGRARVGAELIAEVVNGFVETLVSDIRVLILRPLNPSGIHSDFAVVLDRIHQHITFPISVTTSATPSSTYPVAYPGAIRTSLWIFFTVAHTKLGTCRVEARGRA
jgi:hypothetical protein